MVKSITLLSIFTLLLSACATPILKLELAGTAVPNYIHQARLINSGMAITSVLTVHHKEREGDEFLDVYGYLDRRVNHKIRSEGLQSIVLAATINNPMKEEYRVSVGIMMPSGDIVGRMTVYSGNLSRKEIKYNLPKNKNFSGNILVEITSPDDRLLFQWVPLQYEVK